MFLFKQWLSNVGLSNLKKKQMQWGMSLRVELSVLLKKLSMI